MQELHIDIETYSSADLKTTGVYRYAEAPDFSVLLFAYAYDDDPVQILDLMTEDLPVELISAITNSAIRKTAHNANFEITCLSTYLGEELDPAQWDCTMVRALMLGLPASLDSVGKALKLDKADQKMSEGKSLITYFCKPCKPTKVNGGRLRNLPEHAMEKWDLFKAYCVRDVESERVILGKLKELMEIPEFERKLWALDQKINRRGVLIDQKFVENAIVCATQNADDLTEQMAHLTGVENPNSLTQLKKWMLEKGVEAKSLNKESVDQLLQTVEDQEVKALLSLKSQTGKTSVKKYSAMMDAVCDDGRVKGLFQYYGASRTGRWGGRKVQPQNLPRNYLRDLDLARTLVKDGDFEDLDLLFGNIQDTLSQLIRTAFIAKEGYTFAVSDFSAIEARVIAWLAGENWRLEVFRTHGKIYEASASQMFRVPIEEIGKGSPLRQKGKIAELALGYGGGVGALEVMGALKMGLEEKELKPLVDAWRTANPKITKLWWDVGDAAIAAVQGEGTQRPAKGIAIYREGNVLFISLPSRRKLSYIRPKIVSGKFGRDVISYEDDKVRTETYGPKLVENIVQAIARDCLAEAMMRVEAKGWPIVMHVHDEVVLEISEDNADIEEINRVVGEPLSWAEGLPLGADGYLTKYYMKD